MKVTKDLKETITTSTIRKVNVDGLLKMLTKEKEAEEEEAGSEEEETTTDREDEEQSSSEE